MFGRGFSERVPASSCSLIPRLCQILGVSKTVFLLRKVEEDVAVSLIFAAEQLAYVPFVAVQLHPPLCLTAEEMRPPFKSSRLTLPLN
jgi:hypothetical protein